MNDWVESEGGPLILLSHAHLSAWGGCASDDYDRACECDDYTAVISAGGGVGLVLGDDPAPTRIIMSTEGVLLVRWIYAESDDEVERALEDLPHDGFDLEVREFDAGAAPLWLFDAALAGHESLDVGQAVGIGGKLRVATRIWEPDAETSLVLHRLTRVRATY